VISAHIAAVKELLVADGLIEVPDGGDPPASGICLYDGQVIDHPTFPYVVLWSNAGQESPLAISDDPVEFDARLYVTHVGVTAESVRIIIARTRGVLNGVRLGVPGRKSWKLRLLSSDPIRQDTDVTLPNSSMHPVMSVDMYRLASVPTAA
jgi:hypothetical protein